MQSVPENKLPTTPALTQNKQKKTKFPFLALNFIGQPRRTQLPYFLAVDKPLVPRPSFPPHTFFSSRSRRAISSSMVSPSEGPLSSAAGCRKAARSRSRSVRAVWLTTTTRSRPGPRAQRRKRTQARRTQARGRPTTPRSSVSVDQPGTGRIVNLVLRGGREGRGLTGRAADEVVGRRLGGAACLGHCCKGWLVYY